MTCPTCGRLREKLVEAEGRIAELTAPADDVEVDVPGKGSVRMSWAQRAIWRMLVASQPRMVTKAVLFEATRGGPVSWASEDGKVITVHICHIRKLIAGASVKIANVWGEGYRLVASDGE